jgi:hypothetical protein
MKFSMTGQETSDLLIQVTTWVCLTVSTLANLQWDLCHLVISSHFLTLASVY